jgi:hypothetical protein
MNYELQGFEPLRGGHCESAAMLNALHYLGYGVRESDIIGGGAAPSFLFTNDGFPFIGSRNEAMREIFLAAASIPYKVVVPQSETDGWDEIAALIEEGLPVLLRVDMRYLPYLYGGKYGSVYMSFGWHWVCLYSIDMGERTALLTDTAHGGPCTISLRDLDRARSSKTKMYPPRREYAWIARRPTDWSFDADTVLRLSLDSLLANYAGADDWKDAKKDRAKKPTLFGLVGLADFPAVLAAIHTRVKPFLLAPAYSYMAGSIERNGTGGAAFRRLYGDFIESRARDCADPTLRSACAGILPKVRAAAEAWSALAFSFDEAAASIKASRWIAAKTALTAAEATTSATAMKLYVAESALRDAIARSMQHA